MLIGLVGRARNGKSTAADEIAFRADKCNYVTAMYDIGGMVLEWCKEHGLIPAELKREDLSPEQVQTLVRVGKEKRDEDLNFWIGRIEADYRRLQSLETPRGPKFIGLIPNLRYWNEAKMVKRLGGKIVRVSRLNADGSPFIATDRDPNHPSETELLPLPADYTIAHMPGQVDFVRDVAGLIFYHELKQERA